MKLQKKVETQSQGYLIFFFRGNIKKKKSRRKLKIAAEDKQIANFLTKEKLVEEKSI